MTRIARRHLLSSTLLAAALAPLTLSSAFAGPEAGSPQGSEAGSSQGPEAGSSHGPEAGHRETRAPRLDTLLQSWELSEQARNAIDQANTDFRDKASALETQQFVSRDARHEAWQQLRQAHRAALAEVLDEQQLKALDAYLRLGAPHPGKGPQTAHAASHRELMQALFDSWQLNEDDRQALAQARETLRDDLASLKSRDFDNRDERHAAVKEIREAMHARLAELLSDEQIRVLDLMRQQGRPGLHHGPRHADQRREAIQAIIDSWNLDDEKKAALADAREAMREDMRDLHGEDADNREDRRSAWLEFREEQRERLADILSPAQLDVLEDVMPRHAPRPPRDRAHGGPGHAMKHDCAPGGPDRHALSGLQRPDA
ncbi:hypothetical protein GCM10027040_33350 [Halomonas shantousis]